MDYDAVMIGCGHNGLVCAYYMASAGLRVLALEQAEKVGGLASTDELFGGFRFTTYGHSFALFNTKILDDMRLFDRGLRVDVKDPGTFHPFKTGKALTFWNDQARTVESIARISPHDAKAWPRWVEANTRMGEMLEPYLLTEPPSLEDLAQKFQGTKDEQLFTRMVSGTSRSFLDEYFESDELKASVIATFDSGSTNTPGAMLYWAFHTATASGLSARRASGYPRGGMGEVARILGDAAMDAGVEIKTNARVEHIIVREGRAIGIKLVDGGEISSRVVVSNADPKRTLLDLVDKRHLQPDFVTSADRIRAVAGYFKLHCACNGLPEWTAVPGTGLQPVHMAQTRICDSVGVLDEAWLTAQRGEIPKEYSMAVVSTTVHDPTTAPPGHYCISLWGEFAPIKLATGSWNQMAEVVAHNMIEQVATVAPNFPDIVDDWYLVTPESIADRFGMTTGHMHHTDMTIDQMMNRRPLPGWSDYRTPINQLYLCGSGCHPGGGVTGAPGHNAAITVLKDLERVRIF